VSTQNTTKRGGNFSQVYSNTMRGIHWGYTRNAGVFIPSALLNRQKHVKVGQKGIKWEKEQRGKDKRNPFVLSYTVL